MIISNEIKQELINLFEELGYKFGQGVMIGVESEKKKIHMAKHCDICRDEQ